MIDVDGVGLNRTFMELKLGKAPSSDEEKDKS